MWGGILASGIAGAASAANELAKNEINQRNRRQEALQAMQDKLDYAERIAQKDASTYAQAKQAVQDAAAQSGKPLDTHSADYYRALEDQLQSLGGSEGLLSSARQGYKDATQAIQFDRQMDYNIERDRANIDKAFELEQLRHQHGIALQEMRGQQEEKLLGMRIAHARATGGGSGGGRAGDGTATPAQRRQLINDQLKDLNQQISDLRKSKAAEMESTFRANEREAIKKKYDADIEALQHEARQLTAARAQMLEGAGLPGVGASPASTANAANAAKAPALPAGVEAALKKAQAKGLLKPGMKPVGLGKNGGVIVEDESGKRFRLED